MRDNSTLAKLIAEEDISVVHKKCPPLPLTLSVGN